MADQCISSAILRHLCSSSSAMKLWKLTHSLPCLWTSLSFTLHWGLFATTLSWSCWTVALLLWGLNYIGDIVQRCSIYIFYTDKCIVLGAHLCKCCAVRCLWCVHPCIMTHMGKAKGPCMQCRQTAKIFRKQWRDLHSLFLCLWILCSIWACIVYCLILWGQVTASCSKVSSAQYVG